MKASAPPLKRRRGQCVAAVLLIVLCSLLVPLAFLFDRFPPGYVTYDSPQQYIGFRSHGHLKGSKGSNEQGKQIHGTKKMESTLPTVSGSKLHVGGILDKDLSKASSSSSSPSSILTIQTKVPPVTRLALPKPLPATSKTNDREGGKKKPSHSSDNDEAEESCELEFGSYCHWAAKHREPMRDSVVKKLKDQLFTARAYFPSIAKMEKRKDLSRELKQNIQEHERVLSESTVDADLPPHIRKKIERMERSISRAQACKVDCNNVDRKLRQIFDLTKDEAHFHMKQSAFLYHLGTQTMPKSLHCLNMRLTVEYFRSPPTDSEHLHSHKFRDPKYRHYVLFSKNILAASVTINSTVMNSEATEDMVFHVLTDAQNFYSMTNWFARNSYKMTAIEVINYENIVASGLEQFYMPEEFRVSILVGQPTMKLRMEYLSVFGHSHFSLPEIFKHLKKVVVLDDDVIVQCDLSSLWNVNLGDKVIGAVEYCSVRLGQLRKYLPQNAYDPKSCVWMSGLILVNLDRWREHNLTANYLKLVNQFRSREDAPLREASLPLSMLVFQNLVEPLDEKWVLSGLGRSYDIDASDARNAMILHYNGEMKPWLDLGIPKYKNFWKKYLTREESFMDQCNVHP